MSEHVPSYGLVFWLFQIFQSVVVCCSWQVVSSCGSLRGLVSSHDSPHSVDSSNSSGKLS